MKLDLPPHRWCFLGRSFARAIVSILRDAMLAETGLCLTRSRAGEAAVRLRFIHVSTEHLRSLLKILFVNIVPMLFSSENIVSCVEESWELSIVDIAA